MLKLTNKYKLYKKKHKFKTNNMNILKNKNILEI